MPSYSDVHKAVRVEKLARPQVGGGGAAHRRPHLPRAGVLPHAGSSRRVRRQSYATDNKGYVAPSQCARGPGDAVASEAGGVRVLPAGQ
jgi:hypothetical protein